MQRTHPKKYVIISKALIFNTDNTIGGLGNILSPKSHKVTEWKISKKVQTDYSLYTGKIYIELLQKNFHNFKTLLHYCQG